MHLVINFPCNWVVYRGEKNKKASVRQILTTLGRESSTIKANRRDERLLSGNFVVITPFSDSSFFLSLIVSQLSTNHQRKINFSKL